MTRRLLKGKVLVLVPEVWSSKVINIPWMYHYTKEGYNLCLKQQNILKQLFPNKGYIIKVFSFNRGAETEHPLNIDELK